MHIIIQVPYIYFYLTVTMCGLTGRITKTRRTRVKIKTRRSRSERRIIRKQRSIMNIKRK